MMEEQDYLMVDENHRIGYSYDEGNENPREWGSVVGFEHIAHDNKYIDVISEYSFPGDIAKAHEQFEGANYVWNASNGFTMRFKRYPSAEEITARWARIFYGIEVEYDSKYGGYWFVDPDAFLESWPTPDADGKYSWIGEERLTKAELERKLIAAERHVYEQWASGEVYYVFGQVRRIKEITVKEPEGGWVRQYEEEDWETEDSIGSIYPDEDEEYGAGFEKMLRRVAEEYFSEEYTLKETAE